MDIKRGRIVITKIEGKVSIESVEGLWNGKDRVTIANHLRKAMRKAKYDIVKAHKQADLEKQKLEQAKKLKEEKAIKLKEQKKKLLEEKKKQKIEGLKDEVVVSEKVANKNIKKEEKKKCPKTPKKKKLLMKQPKR